MTKEALKISLAIGAGVAALFALALCAPKRAEETDDEKHREASGNRGGGVDARDPHHFPGSDGAAKGVDGNDVLSGGEIPTPGEPVLDAPPMPSPLPPNGEPAANLPPAPLVSGPETA